MRGKRKGGRERGRGRENIHLSKSFIFPTPMTCKSIGSNFFYFSFHRIFQQWMSVGGREWRGVARMNGAGWKLRRRGWMGG